MLISAKRVGKIILMSELFAQFELNREPRFARRFAQALAVSVVLHVVAIACAVYVPAINNALNIARVFGGMDYADEAYRKTQISDRAVIVNINDGLFRYPEGYFNKNPLVTPDDGLLISQAITEPTPRPLPTPRPIATPKPKPTTSPSPSATTQPQQLAQAQNKNAPNANTAGNTNNANSTNTNNTPPQNAEQQLNQIAQQNGVKRPPTINKRPFVDLLNKAKVMKDAGTLDLSGTIELTIEGDRNPDGTLRNAKVVSSSGSPQAKELALDLITAISDSRALVILEGIEHMTMSVRLDQENVTVSIVSNAETEERAKQMSTGYGTMLATAAIFRYGKDEAEIYKRTKISAKGKQVIMQFSMSRNTAGKLLAKQVD